MSTSGTQGDRHSRWRSPHPRADMLINNKEPGLFSRFSTTQLGGLAIEATLENTNLDKGLIGHVVMGMVQHSHRDSIYGDAAWLGEVVFPKAYPH